MRVSSDEFQIRVKIIWNSTGKCQISNSNLRSNLAYKFEFDWIRQSNLALFCLKKYKIWSNLTKNTLKCQYWSKMFLKGPAFDHIMVIFTKFEDKFIQIWSQNSNLTFEIRNIKVHINLTEFVRAYMREIRI